MKEAIKYLKKAAEELEKLEEKRDNGVKDKMCFTWESKEEVQNDAETEGYAKGKIDGLQQGREEGEAEGYEKAKVDIINKISNL